jgi:RNA polymerase sigma-70 factor (ECF subfamily)
MLIGMPDTSVSLLQRLRLQPDDGTWKRFIDIYEPLIQGWLRRYSVAPEDAEDLSQEVMAILVRKLPEFQHNGQQGAFRNWLRTVTVNQLRLLWRIRKGKPAGRGGSDVAQMLDQLADPESSLSRVWDQEHDRHVARRLMELIEPQFEPKTWLAFRRVALEGRKAAEVAGELGISVNAVLLAKSRVLSRLRREMAGLTD